jgi:hypothetical protein
MLITGKLTDFSGVLVKKKCSYVKFCGMIGSVSFSNTKHGRQTNERTHCALCVYLFIYLFMNN